MEELFYLLQAQTSETAEAAANILAREESTWTEEDREVLDDQYIEVEEFEISDSPVTVLHWVDNLPYTFIDSAQYARWQKFLGIDEKS